MEEFDYGPLKNLIGTWQGDKGMDVAPEPDGTETSPYYETITFEAIGDVENAEEQVLTALHYRQIVRRKSNDEIFHDETGYWMWDAQTKTVMHSLLIPRAVGVLAGGQYNGEQDKDGNTIINVSAKLDHADWGIIQSPFMKSKARTTGFEHEVTVGENSLKYKEVTFLEIYGRSFEHIDQNKLTKVK